MSVNVSVKRKITVDGKEYESLDQIPPDVRVAVLKTLAQGGVNTKATIFINGKTYSSVEDLPAPLRAIVGGLTAFALNKASGEDAGAVRPEPVLSPKMVVVGIALAFLLFWLVRLVF